MNYSLKTGQIEKQKYGCIIVGVDSEKKLSPSAKSLDKAGNGFISQLIKQGDLGDKAGQSVMLYKQPGIAAERILVVTHDETKKLSLNQYKKALRHAISAVKSSGADKVLSTLHELEVNDLDESDKLIESIKVFEQAAYSYNEFKSKAKNKNPSLKQVHFLTGSGQKASLQKAIDTGMALSKGINKAKDLGNCPGNVCTPNYLVDEAKAMAKRYTALTCKIISEKQLERMGAGAFVSVSKGSDQPGSMIIMEYKGSKTDAKPHVLVGKGITFDTGGISLKPGASMDEMKYDMCGAASVFGTMTAIAEMKLPLHVVAIVVAAENMPSGGASKPGDIVKTLSGQTVEILNTDAEGRLVLCDALTYAERYKPASVVDIATLTGACVVALGHHASAVYSNQQTLSDKLVSAGEQSGDRAWPMPLWDEYQEQINSPFADMGNIGGRSAGSITAACFLSRFAKKYHWAHLDNAGSAWVSGGAKKGSTGRPVSLLTQYLMDCSKHKPKAKAQPKAKPKAKAKTVAKSKAPSRRKKA